MNDKHKEIRPEELEVGMEVAYPHPVSIGWQRDFRYPRWQRCFVKRITPKRTKAVLLCKNGATIDADFKKDCVYVPDELMNHENECIEIYKACRDSMNAYEAGRRKYLWSLSDDELKEVHKHFMALDAILRKKDTT